MTIETTTPSETAGGLQETARGLADEVGQTAETRAATLMSQSSDTVREVGRVLRDAAAELGGQQPQPSPITASNRMTISSSHSAPHPGQVGRDTHSYVTAALPTLYDARIVA